MRWQGRAGSGNIEDRRGMGMALPVGGGIGGLVLLLLFSALTGQNPVDIITTQSDETVGTSGVPADDPQAEFVSVVLTDTEETWSDIFRERGADYPEPTLVLFTQAHAVGVRPRPVGHGAVLLPERPAGLSRPVVLPRARDAVRRAGRFRAGLRRRARSRTSRADGHRHLVARAGRERARRASARPMRCRCGWSSRPTATPACGATTPPGAACSNRATPKKA